LLADFACAAVKVALLNTSHHVWASLSISVYCLLLMSPNLPHLPNHLDLAEFSLPHLRDSLSQWEQLMHKAVSWYHGIDVEYCMLFTAGPLSC